MMLVVISEKIAGKESNKMVFIQAPGMMNVLMIAVMWEPGTKKEELQRTKQSWGNPKNENINFWEPDC
jgi:hypothetical protein